MPEGAPIGSSSTKDGGSTPIYIYKGRATLSLGWSMGVITLFVGHLTILSMMFISVVVGLGTDYGTFFLFRYREERLLGRTFIGALERTAARSGPGILLGALTAAVTFYILMTAQFQGIRDFGFISGTAILLSFVSMVTVFPAVVLLFGWPTASGSSSHRFDGRDLIPTARFCHRVRRLEQPIDVFHVDARPRVLDRDNDVLAVRRCSDDEVMRPSVHWRSRHARLVRGEFSTRVLSYRSDRRTAGGLGRGAWHRNSR
jgi:hypothetical protein